MFPSVTFAPAETAGDGAVGDGAPGSDDAGNSSELPDGTIATDAGKKIDEAGCGSDPCDCDGDDYVNKTCDAGPSGLVDCDDLDSRAHPYQQITYLTDPPVAPTNGDWNCDGRVDKYYPDGVKCDGILPKDGCSREGFSGTPACGETAEYVFCAAGLGGLSCKQSSAVQKTQACR